MKIALDIETLESSESEWAYLKGITLSEEAQSIEVGSQFQKEFEKSRFDATYSRVICIGLLVLEESLSPIGAVAWCGENETQILRAFWRKVSIIRPTQFIVHNGLNFDLPFIIKRSIIRAVQPTIEINLGKFRTSPVFDTMAVWANWEVRAFTKLDVLARALNVETKLGSGDQVASLWDQRRHNDIANYCLHDTYVTYGCFCKMNFFNPPSSHSVLAKPSIHIFHEQGAVIGEQEIAPAVR